MKGLVDAIVTDSYSVDIPDELVEKIQADMIAEFTDGSNITDEVLRNIFLNYGDEEDYKRLRKQTRSEILLAYAWFYKDKYGIAANAIGHNEAVKANVK